MGMVVKSYCLDCTWEISGADHTPDERTAAMIDHAITTGHDIESTQTDGADSDNAADETENASS